MLSIGKTISGKAEKNILRAPTSPKDVSPIVKGKSFFVISHISANKTSRSCWLSSNIYLSLGKPLWATEFFISIKGFFWCRRDSS
jgi:hypothetical protein